MDTLFTIRHNFMGMVFRLIFFLIFFAFACFILYQMTFGPFRAFPMRFRWIFIIVAGVFSILGIIMSIKTIHMFFNPIIIQAGRRTIRYKNESYEVSRISRFVYKTHYERDRDGRYLKEELVIEGEDGALIMNIDSKNMKTKELLNLFRTNYPHIELVVLNA